MHMTVGGAETAALHCKSEPFESFKFTPNSISAFYPKCIQKLLARKTKMTSQQQTSERLTHSLK